jgi:SAGA-associated factor 29
LLCQILDSDPYDAEIECWTQAAGQLTTLSQICTSAATAETIQRVNRLMAGWPTEDELPPDGLEGLRSTARKLEQGFLDIKRDAEEEVR